MCYSAMVAQHLKSLGLRFQARIDESLMQDLYKRRANGEKVKIPRGLDMNFLEPTDQAGIEIKSYLDSYKASTIQEFEIDLFTQKKRLADAERKIFEKPTKTAEKDKGIAERKIEALKRRLEKLQSDVSRPEDSRIYAMDHAPVIVWEGGGRIIKPMRYHLRSAGMPESFDRDYPGCYNARRDSLKKFWKKQYLRNHAILVIDSFFENVRTHNFEHRKLRKGEEEENLVIQFKPQGFEQMIVPCIWDRWTKVGYPDLYSFALITDNPPQEVLDAGHDRCPIFIKESNVDRWLRPELTSEEEIDEVLDDRETPYYECSKVA